LETAAPERVASRRERPMRDIQHFVDGRLVAGKSGRTGDVFDPATGQVSAKVPFASAQEVAGAIAAAERAFPGWATTPPLRRARVLFKFKDLIERDLDGLAAIVTAEHGKVL